MSQCSIHQERHASARLVILHDPQPPPSPAMSRPPSAVLLPNPLAGGSRFGPVLVSVARTPTFRREVVGAGGTAQFDVRTSPLGLDVQTSSGKRDDADKTLTVVVGLLTRHLTDIQKQAGASPSSQLVVATRSDA